MSCTYLNALRIVRHDKIVQVITRVARLAGVATHIEPRIDDEDSRVVMVISSHSQSSIFDVVDPCAQTYVVAAQHPLVPPHLVRQGRLRFMVRCRELPILSSET